MKRYLYYLTTILLVFSLTDYCLGGGLFNLSSHVHDGISASMNGVSTIGDQSSELRKIEGDDAAELGRFIAAESCDFVRSAFRRDRERIADMLSGETEYMVFKDNSSYIRYAAEDLHVEGYMATDKKLVMVRHCWHVIEKDDTITSAVEVAVEGEKECQTWYIHYRNSSGKWKIFMLENGV